MDNKMFCFQCEQTLNGKGCTGNAGVCGKKSNTANLQDKLTAALINLAYVVKGNENNISIETDNLLLKALFATVTNVNFDDEAIKKLIERVEAEKQKFLPECAEFCNNCSQNHEYDMERIWSADEDVRSLKSTILFGLRGMAAYAYHAAVLGYTADNITSFCYRALRYIGMNKASVMDLLPLALDLGEMNLKCMALLDKANTETFGNPNPTKVSLTIERGPFIIVSGHDLYDLKELLEQTENMNINIYTHGEMLPAHAYPKLKKYPHLKGNFGTAWQNQQREFDNIPAPILFTTNCIMPPKASYIDRVFTTSVVAYPEIKHIDNNKDFTPVIQRALQLGGYQKDMHFTGINGGHNVLTGFGHDAILENADKIIEAIKAGKIKHIFLVGGCDGAKPGRNYYTEFVQKAPPDTIILTLACGKYRFNDLDLGTIAGIPRLIDIGQCNDAYSAIKVATTLAQALECEVNELPLSLVLSWYEQKAVCILLTLLHLNIQNIRLGPTLPAFISPNVLTYLQETYKIAPITTPEKDLEALLAE